MTIGLRLDRALALDAGHTDSLMGRGRARLSTGDVEGGRADLERLLELIQQNDPKAAAVRRLLESETTPRDSR